MAGIERDRDEGPGADRADPLLGRVLADRYEIRRLIGEGGMGRVYEGRQRALDRAVAVKCIHPHLLTNEPMLIRFMEEARIASRLVHPNVVKIYDFGKTEPPEAPTFFLVMELLTGRDLASVLRDDGRLPIRRTGTILRQILLALGEAHELGITHRDTKPENVILEPGAGGRERVKIIDFGIAKVHGRPGATTVGQFVGTPHYMAPEQIRGERAEVTSDLYAAGIVLFQMLTGELPFTADSVAEVLDKQLHAPRPDPREARPDIPPALAELCRRAIDIDPARRFATADAFIEALDAASGSGAQAIQSVAPTSTTRATRHDADTLRPPPAEVLSAASLDLGAAERIESAADAELAAGRLDAAESQLRRGLALGHRWLDAGELELGEAALSAFGRKLGALLRDLGRLEHSEQILRAVLDRAPSEETGRARLLAELVMTLAERGRVVDAETYRVQALRIASTNGDRELVARLRRLAQSLALALATGGAVSAAGTPPPRASEWRVKHESNHLKEEDEERARRRR